MKAKDYIENYLEIKVPETLTISGSWFAQNSLPMIVECTHCGMTMSLFSADVKRDGMIFCSSCAPDEEEYNKSLDELHRAWEEYISDEEIEVEISVDDDDYDDINPDEFADMNSCDITGICSVSCDLYYKCNMQCKG